MARGGRLFMRNVCWALFLLSVLAFLLGVFAKFAVFQPFGFLPVAWWRAAMGLALYALVLAKLRES
jgi:hypothetical protein